MKSSRMDSSGFSDECSLMRARSDERLRGQMSGTDSIANFWGLLDGWSWVGAQTETRGRRCISQNERDMLHRELGCWIGVLGGGRGEK